MGWTIRQASKLTGLSADTLRYYDKLGIISPKREENGYRHYGERELTLLQYVAVMKYARFSLSEIKTIIQSFSRPASDECNRLNRDILTCKRAELAEAVRNQRSIIRLIDTTLPMVENREAYLDHEQQLDDFVSRIFKSIQPEEKEKK